MKIKIPSFYSQRDVQWGNTLLGFNTNTKFTIHDYGCLITTFGNYIGKTPAEINTIVKNALGFVPGGGDFIWSKSTILGLNQTYLSPSYAGPVTDQGIAKAKEILDTGCPLVCEIDFNPATIGEEQHYVLINGYAGDALFAVDPWTGTQINLDVYGGPKRAIVRFRAYDKKLALDGNVDDIQGQLNFCIVDRDSHWNDRSAIATKLNVENNMVIILAELDKLISYEDVVVQKDKQLSEASVQVNDLSTKVATLLSDHDDLTFEIGLQAQTIQDQDNQIKEISVQVEELKKLTKEPVLSGWKRRLHDWLLRQ